MALTVTAIAPTSGAARGGVLVTITGSGFALPASPAPTGPGGAVPETVRVWIGGQRATEVKVFGADMLTCIVPAYRGDADVEVIAAADVRVANLDDDGEETEDETLADGFTWVRPALNGNSDQARLVREVLRALKRAVIRNVVMSTHVDFDDDVADGLDVVAEAELPVIELGGPSVIEDRIYATNDEDFEDDAFPDGAAAVHRNLDTVDLRFRLRAIAEERLVLLDLEDACDQFFAANPKLKHDRSGSDPSAGVVEYDLFWTGRWTDRAFSNLHAAEAEFEVRGFARDLGVIGRGYVVATDPVVETVDLEVA